MVEPVLERGSKFRDAIARLQLALKGAGFSVQIDGAFGRATEKAVVEFQKKHQLETNGIVDEATWQTLTDAVTKEEANPLESNEALPGFHGDLDWVYAWQPHAGGPFWPGGSVGVTLDPGLDLGHVSKDTIVDAYREHLDEAQWEAVEAVIGVRGEAAQEALRSNKVLRRLDIDRPTAASVFPHVADPAWRALLRRFPSLGRDDTPSEVQTAMLSLVIDRGPTDGSFKPLRRPLADRDWPALAEAIGNMQQHHRLDHVHERRREEAALVRRLVD